jgi:hypothetical protein
VAVAEKRVRRRSAGSPKRSQRPVATTVATALVNIGAPDSDGFTKSVFHSRLKKAIPKLIITSQPTDKLRRQVINFVKANVKGKNNSLDIVADAPGGIQIIFQDLLLRIVLDPQSKLDEELVACVKERFTQFRLLGCVTGIDGEVYEHARTLANRLGMPAVGTLRLISYEDFDDKRFKDTQGNGQKIVTVIDPDSVDSPTKLARRLELAERVQTAWLGSFPQKRIQPNDIIGVLPPDDSWIWEHPSELVGSTVAATDAIRTFVDAVVMLRTPSGTRFRAELLARATLLRLQSRRYGPVYLNVPPASPQRQDWLSRAPKRWPTIPRAI